MSVLPIYQKKQSDYAATYKRSVKTIGRWQKLGYPLDDVAATQRILAGGGLAAAGGASAASQAPRLKGTGERGLAAATERLRTAELDAAAAYEQAAESGDEMLANVRLKQWLTIQKSLRECEEATPDVQQANANVVPVVELQAALSELFNRHRQDLENLGKRVAIELIGKDEIGIRGILDREAAILVNNLFDFSYAEGVTSES